MCARWQFPLHLAPDLRHSVDHRPALGEGAVQIPDPQAVEAVLQGEIDLGLNGAGILKPDLMLSAAVVHVAEPGGLGLIGGANAPGEAVREEIRKAREMTKKPFGVNVMLMSPYADDVAKVVVEEGIKVVTTGAGIPGKYMGMWKEAGIRVIPVVASVALAKRMEKYGADAVVAEGMESGGHIGSITTFALVPQVADAVGISDYNYFSRVFRSLTGTTPRTFRENGRQKAQNFG